MAVGLIAVSALAAAVALNFVLPTLRWRAAGTDRALLGLWFALCGLAIILLLSLAYTISLARVG